MDEMLVVIFDPRNSLCLRIKTGLPGQGRNGFRVVAGDDFQLHSSLAEILNRCSRFRPQLISQGYHTKRDQAGR